MLLIPTSSSQGLILIHSRIYLWGLLTVMDIFRKDSNGGRPNSDSHDRHDHFWHDATMHSHHDGPLGVFIHVTGSMLSQAPVSSVLSSYSMFLSCFWSSIGFIAGYHRLTKYRSNSLESRRSSWNCESREVAKFSKNVGRGVIRPTEEACSFSWICTVSW